MPRKFDYGSLARLEKKLAGVVKYESDFRKKIGKSPKRHANKVVKGLKKVVKDEDNAQMKHKLKLVARDKYASAEAVPLEKELDSTIRFVFGKDDPRRKELGL